MAFKSEGVQQADCLPKAEILGADLEDPGKSFVNQLRKQNQRLAENCLDWEKKTRTVWKSWNSSLMWSKPRYLIFCFKILSILNAGTYCALLLWPTGKAWGTGQNNSGDDFWACCKAGKSSDLVEKMRETHSDISSGNGRHLQSGRAAI